MTTFGAKASQLGYEVDECADYELTFSSEFPMLKIEHQGSVTITDSKQNQDIYTHNLGYIPAFWVFDNKDSGKSRLANLYSYNFVVNSTKLSWVGDPSLSGAHTFYYFIFRWNLLTEFTGAVINTEQTSQGSYGDYGIKVAKSGKSINSLDYRDYVIHSNCKSPIIHMTGVVGPYFPTCALIPHYLGYAPLFFQWISDDNKNSFKLMAKSPEEYVGSDETYIIICSIDNTYISYMVFKDPMYIG